MSKIKTTYIAATTFLAMMPGTALADDVPAEHLAAACSEQLPSENHIKVLLYNRYPDELLVSVPSSILDPRTTKVYNNQNARQPIRAKAIKVFLSIPTLPNSVSDPKSLAVFYSKSITQFDPQLLKTFLRDVERPTDDVKAPGLMQFAISRTGLEDVVLFLEDTDHATPGASFFAGCIVHNNPSPKCRFYQHISGEFDKQPYALSANFTLPLSRVQNWQAIRSEIEKLGKNIVVGIEQVPLKSKKLSEHESAPKTSEQWGVELAWN